MSSAAAPHRAHCDQVLVVDVSQPGLAARRMVLEEQGLSVATARSAEEAIQRLSESPFQLMVAVHHASRLDTRELIRQARRLKPGLPVILVCTDADALGMTAASTGADLVLSKGANEVAQLIRGASRLLRPNRRKPPARQGAASQLRKRRL